MKKILILFCIILTCSSCEIQYDGETRLVVEGQLIDKNSNPVSDKKIEITVLADGYVSSDLISYTNTDQNGKFSLAFPSPKGDNSLMISINDIKKNEFQYKRITAVRETFDNYKLNLNQIILYPENDITQLQIILNQTTPSKQIKDIKIEGAQPDYNINLRPAIDTGNYTPPSQTLFDVLKNHTITLNYTTVDYSDYTKIVTTNHSESVTINTEKTIHAITY